ncbi:MAG: sulfatase-like hydrolase/transferase [Chitinivibrionales bacterium]|nr:sulfatase-like hydrolase/transferase [Chitinivibrionales bacterium]
MFIYEQRLINWCYRRDNAMSGIERRRFLKSMAVGGMGMYAATHPALGASFLASASGAQRPNIVLIMADDLGYETIGAYGSASYRTPHIDELAATGVKFEHCHSQPLCTPSRVKIMTGKFNVNNYVKFKYLDPNEKTFGNMLKAAGYKTCITGKWQLSSDDDRLEMPGHFGFDDWCLWHFGGADKGNRYYDPKLWQNGVLRTDTQGKFGPDVCTDFACDFIDRNKAEPFFVYYPMILTHDPFVWAPDATAETKFGSLVEHMDKKVGQITAKLDSLGLRENTLIIFTGDNGTLTSVESLMTDGSTVSGTKGLLGHDSTRVPMVANWRGTIPAGGVSNDMVDFADMFPTFAEMAGQTIGDDIDGVSLVSVLTGNGAKRRDWVFIDFKSKTASEFDWMIATREWGVFKDGSMEQMVSNPSESREAARARLSTIALNIMAGNEPVRTMGPAPSQRGRTQNNRSGLFDGLGRVHPNRKRGTFARRLLWER